MPLVVVVVSLFVFFFQLRSSELAKFGYIFVKIFFPSNYDGKMNF